MSDKDVFLSHSSKDNATVSRIYETLKENGITAWLDLNDIPPDGGVFAGHITQGINQAKAFLLVLSKEANLSPHVLNEVSLAFSRRLPFIIYNIDLPETEFSDDLKYYLANKQFIKASTLGEKKALQLMVKITKERLLGNTTSSFFGLSSSPTKNKVPEQSSTRSLFLFFILICLSCYAFFKEEIIDFFTAEKYQAVEFKKGDILSLGTYHHNPILWVYAGAIDGADNSKFISRNLITAKPFDVAHSGHYQIDKSGLKDKYDPNMTIMDRLKLYNNEQLIEMYGSSDYEKSTIRLWLNSGEKKVSYNEQTPSQTNIDTYNSNKYLVSSNLDNLDEGGFLQEFSNEDLKLLKESVSRYMLSFDNREKSDNKGNGKSIIWHSISLFQESDTIQENNLPLMLNKYKGLDQRNFAYRDVKEYVAIPSLDEVLKLYQNPALNLQYQFDAANNNGNITDHGWWTRTNCGYMPYTSCVIQPAATVNRNLMVVPTTVSSLIPVRPAITVDVSKIECAGNGSKSAPYRCRKK